MARRADKSGRKRRLLAAVASAALSAACGPYGETEGPAAEASRDNRRGASEYARGQLTSAEQSFGSALAQSATIDDTTGRAVALLNLSRVDGARWQHDRALDRATEAVTIASHDPALHGAALARLASIQSLRGQHDDAIAGAREAVSRTSAVDLRRRPARRLTADRETTLAFTLVRAGGGHCSEAEQVLAQAADHYGRGAPPAAEAALAHLHGQLALGRNRPAAAQPWFARALELDRDRGRPLDVATDLESLATCAERSGDSAGAASWLLRALAVRAAIDTPRQAVATVGRLAALGVATPQIEGQLAVLRSEVGDAATQPPAPAVRCN